MNGLTEIISKLWGDAATWGDATVGDALCQVLKFSREVRVLEFTPLGVFSKPPPSSNVPLPCRPLDY